MKNSKISLSVKDLTKKKEVLRSNTHPNHLKVLKRKERDEKEKGKFFKYIAYTLRRKKRSHNYLDSTDVNLKRLSSGKSYDSNYSKRNYEKTFKSKNN